jgi:hypothetical protein
MTFRPSDIGTAAGYFDGGLPNRNRTCDPKLRRLVLYPTELWADCKEGQTGFCACETVRHPAAAFRIDLMPA